MGLYDFVIRRTCCGGGAAARQLVFVHPPYPNTGRLSPIICKLPVNSLRPLPLPRCPLRPLPGQDLRADTWRYGESPFGVGSGVGTAVAIGGIVKLESMFAG